MTPANWVLKSINKETDATRDWLLSAAVQLGSFDAKELAERAAKMMHDAAVDAGHTAPPPVPSALVTQVLHEVADFKRGEKTWHLKTGMI